MDIKDIIILLLLSLMVYLFIRFSVHNKKLDKFIDVIDDILKGNGNRRLHFRGAGLRFNKLSKSFNTLLENLEKTKEHKEFLEASKKRLISDISHDLRTPLTSILGYVEAIKKDNTLTEEEKSKYLDIIEAKEQSIFQLLKEFLEISKLESEDIPINFVKCDICELIRQALAGYYQRFSAENLKLELELPEKAIYVSGDNSLIERIFDNLILNAVKYGKAGGVIGVGIREDKDRIWLDIWDRGKGIDKKDIGFIFERLYTAEPSRNQELQGSGLGLSIVKKLVEKLGGEIQVKSTPNDMTVFSFYLLRYNSL